jgi:O-succinylbenzoic acid--CoA ligase
MAGVVALDLPASEDFVRELRRLWDRGDAVLPVDGRLPSAARRSLLDTLQPTSVVDIDGEHRLEGRPTEDGDALVIATSGTSGTPKGVVLTHDAVTASARATNARLGVTAEDHWLACLPLAHVGGLTVITKALAAGTALTVLPRFDPADVLAAAGAGATCVSLVATALRRIDPSLFRVVVLGGSAPPPGLPDNVVTTYGSTETGSGIVYDGRPLDGVEVDVDGSGEILVRSPTLLRCYRDGRDPRDARGWFHTGDAGAWDGDGRLLVHGRRGDLIITGGENVWPDAIERVLAGARGVAEVAVAGVADEEWGQRVVAWVVPAASGDPPDLELLRRQVHEILPAYMAPRELRLVGGLPRTALGKVVRSALTSGGGAGPQTPESDR